MQISLKEIQALIQEILSEQRSMSGPGDDYTGDQIYQDPNYTEDLRKISRIAQDTADRAQRVFGDSIDDKNKHELYLQLKSALIATIKHKSRY